MDGVLLRVVLVAITVVIALVAGYVATRWQLPHHPPVNLTAIDVPPGLIAFTSTQCDNCKRVMAMVSTLDVPVREVTHELEPAAFTGAGVEAVPLLVVTDRAGIPVRQLAGTPRKPMVKRALRKAGW